MNVVLLDLDQGSRRIEAAALRYGGYEVWTIQAGANRPSHMYGLTQPMRYSSILLNLIMHS